MEATTHVWAVVRIIAPLVARVVVSNPVATKAIEKEREQLDARLAKRVYQDDRVKLLMTLPGVSQQVAQGVVAAMGKVTRFESPEKLASYMGLVPSTRQSASKCYHGGITKAGRVQARWLLVQAAQCARLDLGPLGHFFNKVKRRKCHNVAVVAVARKAGDVGLAYFEYG
jgi:transposase